MRRTLLASILVVVPSVAFAIDYTNVSSNYTDAPFSTADAAGISVLTNIGAVSGNPDGTFAPARTLNRAEFTKIALIPYLTAHSNPFSGYDYYKNGSVVNGKCFPDVSVQEWFGEFVCEAKDLGVVAGNPDGLFHPERPVNYVEALKILDILYAYPLPDPAPNVRWQWYTPYMIAAQAHGVTFSEDVKPDAFLTRGQMARLAAAYIAANEGQLDVYRAFEQGSSISVRSSSSSSKSSSSASSTSSSVSSSSSSSSSSSKSSSSSSSALTFPAVSHFLPAGTTTPVLYDGTIQATENVWVSSVEVELYHEVRSFNTLGLYDQNGKLIATLSLQNYSNTAKTKWRVDYSTGSYVIPGNTPMQVGIVATMNGVGNGAVSNELVGFKSLNIFTVGTQSNVSQEIAPTNTHNPGHQTTFGRMTGVKSTMASTASVMQGTQRQIGSFTLTAAASSGANVWAKSLMFDLQSTDVTVSHIQIGSGSAQESDCASEQSNGHTFLTCLIPEALQQMSATPVTFSVFADLSVSAAKQTGVVQLVSAGDGSIGNAGVVNWTDGSGNFNWMEDGYPADGGPVMTVTK